MRFKKIPIIIGAFSLCCFYQISARGQGGWDVWTVYLRDGSRVNAAPVWSLDEKFLKYGMSGKVGEGESLKRSLISYMSRNVHARQSSGDVGPVSSEGDVEKDLVIMRDGQQLSGTVVKSAKKLERRDQTLLSGVGAERRRDRPD